MPSAALRRSASVTRTRETLLAIARIRWVRGQHERGRVVGADAREVDKLEHLCECIIHPGIFTVSEATRRLDSAQTSGRRVHAYLPERLSGPHAPTVAVSRGKTARAAPRGP